MTIDVKSLRKRSKQDYNNRLSSAEKMNQKDENKESYKDERFWKLDWKNAGEEKGMVEAVIRLLPERDDEDFKVPWVHLKKFMLQKGKGKDAIYYMNNSRTTIKGEKDPMAELNSRDFASGDEGKAIARSRSMTERYLMNVLVVKDPEHPENDGKVFIWECPKKVFEKITEELNGDFSDEDGYDVFSPFEGANFRLVLARTEQGGYPNYDRSKFKAVSEIADSDDEIAEILEKRHRLSDFVAPNQFKAYQDLREEVARFVGIPLSEVPDSSKNSADESEPASKKADESKQHKSVIEDADKRDKELQEVLGGDDDVAFDDDDDEDDLLKQFTKDD